VTLGVLPFANLSDDPAREHLADGLTEETIAALGQVGCEHLSVIGRTSTLRFKRTRKSLADIGRELGADYLVESSIRGESDWLRIASRLVRVRDQAQVWSASYDREPVNLLRLQREICTAIAGELRVRLSPELDVDYGLAGSASRTRMPGGDPGGPSPQRPCGIAGVARGRDVVFSARSRWAPASGVRRRNSGSASS
jgi:TolB-like protein